MDVGKRITQLRIQRNLSTNKLANMARVSQSYLRDVELGNKNPTVEFLYYICFSLGVSLEAFFAEDCSELDPGLMTEIRKLNTEEQLRLADFLRAINKPR